MRNWELVELYGIARYVEYLNSLTPGELKAVKQAIKLERKENASRRENPPG